MQRTCMGSSTCTVSRLPLRWSRMCTCTQQPAPFSEQTFGNTIAHSRWCGGLGCAPASSMHALARGRSAAAAAAHIHSQWPLPRAAPRCRAQRQPCSSGPPCGHTAAARLGTRAAPAAPAPQPPAPESRPQSCSGPAARERRQQGTSAGCALHIAGHGGNRPSSTQVGGLLLLLPSYSCCNNCSGVLPPAAAARRPPPL